MEISNDMQQLASVFDINGIENTVSQNKSDKIKQTASQFAAIFVNEMLKSARKTQFMDNELFNSSQEKMATGLYDQQMALNVTKNDAFGISSMIEAQLKSR